MLPALWPKPSISGRAPYRVDGGFAAVAPFRHRARVGVRPTGAWEAIADASKARVAAAGSRRSKSGAL